MSKRRNCYTYTVKELVTRNTGTSEDILIQGSVQAGILTLTVRVPL